ncbi:MAG: DUF2911 domain-containing protein [Gemmatimonas sp.]|uniref:DUF2911 domain-containing protein n=1 Tax=Gemmatimonas sp. TaxID=1962908 RepID=UPI00334012F9|nr:DUF2911 domain-containing protein [Gemmatimonadota bacterium]
MFTVPCEICGPVHRVVRPDRPSRRRWLGVSLLASVFSAAPATAQSASLVYRLGKDTVAIEQYTRLATGIDGEMVQRSGAAVVLWRYALTLGTDGRPRTALLARVPIDGTLPTGTARETRLTVSPDSIVREVVFADSVPRRSFAASQALINFPTFIYGPTEVLAGLARGGARIDSMPALGMAGTLGFTGATSIGGDLWRLRGGAYAMVLRFDGASRLQSVDGSGTTNKVVATRGPGGIDLAAVARSMRPTGVLSLRENVRAAFGPGGMVVIDYGRPQVRERTVWGGTLIPFDSVWRAGANDATHLFTTRTLTMGSVTLAPGMYTLWVQHTRTGTFLIVNKQTGQWGTQYDPVQDLGRVPMELVDATGFREMLTISVQPAGTTRGTFELAWGDKVARVPFTVSAR